MLARATLTLVLLALATLSVAAQSGFPYDRDLVFQAPPMRGSKRVPILTFDQGGKMQIDLWCKRGDGQASIANGVLTITIGTMKDEAGCSAERVAADEEMLAALAAVTGLALEGDIVTLTGAKPLRFRAATN